MDLGGPNYFRTSANIVDADGNEVLASRGYRYFGAAKDLPGVRDLFRKSEVAVQKRTRSQMYKCADAAYFGYRDDDDAILAPLEKAAEERLISDAVLEWTERQANGGADEDDAEEAVEGFTAHVPVPKAEDIERAVLEQKKKEMLARCGRPYAPNKPKNPNPKPLLEHLQKSKEVVARRRSSVPLLSTPQNLPS